MNTLSPNARRVLDLFNELAVDAFVDVTWSQLTSELVCSRSSIAAAIRELKAARIVEQLNIPGHSARYHLIAEQTADTSDQQADDCTGLNRCTPVYTGSSDDIQNDLSDDDEALPAYRQIKSLLGEFLIEEPIRSKLAHALLPFTGQPEQIRAVCERTLSERVWRNPRGVMVRRLQAMAAGLQDPLPVFASVMATPAAPASPRKPSGASKRKGGVTRRPQIEYTDEQRAAKQADAQRRIAERAARRAQVSA